MDAAVNRAVELENALTAVLVYKGDLSVACGAG